MYKNHLNSLSGVHTNPYLVSIQMNKNFPPLLCRKILHDFSELIS